METGRNETESGKNRAEPEKIGSEKDRVVGGPEGALEFDWCAPCGVCRQVMKEFCHEDAFQIILARSVKEYKVYTLAELLPMGFGPDNLQ